MLVSPTLNLFFDVDTDCAGRNVDKKGFREYVGSGRDAYESSISIQQRARNKYIEIAERYDDVEIIPCTENNAMRSPESISENVMSILRSRGLI